MRKITILQKTNDKPIWISDEEAIQIDDVSVRQESSQQDPDSTKGELLLQ